MTQIIHTHTISKSRDFQKQITQIGTFDFQYVESTSLVSRSKRI